MAAVALCSDDRSFAGPRLKLVAADPGGLTLPFAWLYAHVPGMTAIRAPGRFANTAFLALAVLAAMGAAWLLRRIPTVAGRRSSVVRPSSLIAILVAAIILAEYAGGLGHFAVQPMPPTDGPFYAWLAEQPPAALIELPLTSEMAGKPDVRRARPRHRGRAAPWPDYNLLRTQYFQTGHWQPTVDGYSGFVPPHHRELGLAMAHFPDAVAGAAARAGRRTRDATCRSARCIPAGSGRRAARALAQTPGVSHERDFGSEWVYRLQPEAERLGQVTGRFWSDGRWAGVPHPVMRGWAGRGDPAGAAAERAGIVAAGRGWGDAAV